MLIECTSCHTQYNVDSAFPQNGRKVKCVRCGNVWIATIIPEPQFPEPQIRKTPELSEGAESDEDGLPVEADVSQIPSLDDVEIPTSNIQAISPDYEEFDEIEFDGSEIFEEVEENLLSDATEADLVDDDEVIEPEIASEEQSGNIANDPEEAKISEQILEKAEDSEQILENSTEEKADKPEPDIDSEIRADNEFLRSSPIEPEAIENIPLSATRPAVDYQQGGKGNFSTLTVFGWVLFMGFVSSLFYGAYVYRDSIVKELPKMEEFYRMAGISVDVNELEFDDLKYEWTTRAGNPIVKIQGVVRNLTDSDKNVPKFVFAFHDDQNREVLSWTRSIEVDSISAQEEQAFTIALPAPPIKVKFLQVRLSKSD